MPDRKGPLAGRLGTRLVVAFGIALLPMAILAYAQAARVQSEARARSEAALVGATLTAVRSEVQAITALRGAASALAVSVGDLRDDPARCSALMQRATVGLGDLAFAGFIPLDGRATCTSTGTPQDLRGVPVLVDTVADPVPRISVSRRGRVSGQSVLIVSHPVLAADGRLAGVVALSLPHDALSVGEQADNGLDPMALVTFDAEGTVLTALFGLDDVAQRLPAGRELASLVGLGATAFTGRDDAKQLRTFAVVPIIEGQLYALSAWRPAQGDRILGGALPLWVFPVLMWAASLLVAFLAAEFQVLRHVRTLKRSIIGFSRGDRSMTAPDLRGAPNEFRDVGDAYLVLVEAVLHNEATLEDGVHQREVLLREVHHRVKNNLQLIASIMNLQMRKAASPEAKALVKGLHDRVMSLATVHRELYQTTGLTDVQADELLSTIVAQVLRMGSGPDRRIVSETRFEPIRLTPDQAVPLSLVMTEALTNVLKHARPDKFGAVGLQVSLTRDDDPAHAVLRVANTSADVDTPGPDGGGEVDGSGLGGQLYAAFAMQLGGTVTHGTEAEGYAVEVRFPIRPLVEGEERFTEGAEDAS